MAFRRAAGSLALRYARSSRSFNTVSKSVAAAAESPACLITKPQVHLSRCFSAAAEPAPAPAAVKGYVTQVTCSLDSLHYRASKAARPQSYHLTLSTSCSARMSSCFRSLELWSMCNLKESCLTFQLLWKWRIMTSVSFWRSRTTWERTLFVPLLWRPPTVWSGDRSSLVRDSLSRYAYQLVSLCPAVAFSLLRILKDDKEQLVPCCLSRRFQ